jgi:hypothetical protein
MLASRDTKGHHKRRLTAATSTSAAHSSLAWAAHFLGARHSDREYQRPTPLSANRRVPQDHRDRTELPDLVARPIRNLPGVRTTFNSNQSSSSLPVKLRKELVRFAFGFMEPWRDHPIRAYRIGERGSAVAEFPLQRSSLQ